MVSLVFLCDILQLPNTVISNSEKYTHPTVQCTASCTQTSKGLCTTEIGSKHSLNKNYNGNILFLGIKS